MAIRTASSHFNIFVLAPERSRLWYELLRSELLLVLPGDAGSPLEERLNGLPSNGIVVSTPDCEKPMRKCRGSEVFLPCSASVICSASFAT